MKRIVLSALGLIVLGAAIVVGVFAVFGNLGVNTYIASNRGSVLVGLEAMPEQTNEDQQTAAATIGETVVAGDVAWTVTDAHEKGELHTYTFPQETVPGSYVSLAFTAENVSEEPVTLTQETIVLFDSEGNEFLPEADRNNGFVVPEKNLLFTESGLLEPGQTKEGRVNFEVLRGSSGFEARLGDTDPTAGEERYVDLGF